MNLHVKAVLESLPLSRCYVLDVPGAELGLGTYRPVTLLVEPGAGNRDRDYVVKSFDDEADDGGRRQVWQLRGVPPPHGQARQWLLQGVRQGGEAFGPVRYLGATENPETDLPTMDRVAAIILNPGAPYPLRTLIER